MLWYSNCRKKSRKISVKELDTPEKSMLCLTFHIASSKIRNKVIHTMCRCSVLLCLFVKALKKWLDVQMNWIGLFILLACLFCSIGRNLGGTEGCRCKEYELAAMTIRLR